MRWGSGIITTAVIGGTATIIAVTDGQFVDGECRLTLFQGALTTSESVAPHRNLAAGINVRVGDV